jgi:hypothetical protein
MAGSKPLTCFLTAVRHIQLAPSLWLTVVGQYCHSRLRAWWSALHKMASLLEPTEHCFCGADMPVVLKDAGPQHQVLRGLGRVRSPVTGQAWLCLATMYVGLPSGWSRTCDPHCVWGWALNGAYLPHGASILFACSKHGEVQQLGAEPGGTTPRILASSSASIRQQDFAVGYGRECSLRRPCDVCKVVSTIIGYFQSYR